MEVFASPSDFLYFFLLPWALLFILLWLFFEKTKILGKDKTAKKSNKLISVFLSLIFVISMNQSFLVKNFVISIPMILFSFFLVYFIYFSGKRSTKMGMDTVKKIKNEQEEKIREAEEQAKILNFKSKVNSLINLLNSRARPEEIRNVINEIESSLQGIEEKVKDTNEYKIYQRIKNSLGG